jgi:mannose-6-phosphate isomerase class I
MRTPNYDKQPIIDAAGSVDAACLGWNDVIARLRLSCEGSLRRTIAIECYPGVFEAEIQESVQTHWPDALLIDTRGALLPETEINTLVAPYLGGDDPLFGFICNLTLDCFFASGRLEAIHERAQSSLGPVVIVGTGAFLAAPEDALRVYADLPRWEAQQRQRRKQIANLGSADQSVKASLQYKRAFFVDWRVCDELKRSTMGDWDYLLDTTIPDSPRIVTGEAFRAALAHVATRPFRVVPFFDPGPWGGQWMKEVCDLDRSEADFAWCFDCVPEENSLRLRFGAVEIEIPSIDLVFAQPSALLGVPVQARFGSEFPIRFDLLDTMGGGNLSLQVHPLAEYIREQFGMSYTQDESYYLLDAKPGAQVYLGCKSGTTRSEMEAALTAAERGEFPFDDNAFIARFPAKKHDHFLIPAGTLHCSGADAMVLEISATPYIFTFKLWDWGRLGLDGLPRPINISRGLDNVQWERDEVYAAQHLVNGVLRVAEGDDWYEERTGLHEAEFIETRRHWFSGTVAHDTGGQSSGGVNVLNLVEGDEAIVESPSGSFEPFVVHYAETFIVPAAVGAYTIRPHGRGLGQQCATIKAFVRGDA